MQMAKFQFLFWLLLLETSLRQVNIFNGNYKSEMPQVKEQLI